MMELAQLMGAALFKTNGWAQSSPYPASTRRPMDVRVLCSMNVSKYVLMSSFMDVQQ